MFFSCLFHGHKTWKDSLEVSLDRVLFAAEFEFPKILVPRLPQNSPNVNIECAENQSNCIIYVTNFLEHWYIFILFNGGRVLYKAVTEDKFWTNTNFPAQIIKLYLHSYLVFINLEKMSSGGSKKSTKKHTK